MSKINRAERRRLERENKSKNKDEYRLIKWVQSLTEEQKNVINEVVNEKVRDRLLETDKYIFECIGSALEIKTDKSKEEIEDIIEYLNDLLIMFKNSTLELKEMNQTTQKQIENECNILIEKDLEPLEAIDSLHTTFPNIRSSDLVRLYKKNRAEFLKPKVPVDMDIELKEFDKKKDKAKEFNKKAYEKHKAKKKLEKENLKDEKLEVEQMSEQKTKFKVIEQQLTLETELGIYKVSAKGVTANIVENENTTFAKPEEAKKYIGKLIDNLMAIDQEIQDCFKTYINKQE